MLKRRGQQRGSLTCDHTLGSAFGEATQEPPLESAAWEGHTSLFLGRGRQGEGRTKAWHSIHIQDHAVFTNFVLESFSCGSLFSRSKMGSPGEKARGFPFVSRGSTTRRVCQEVVRVWNQQSWWKQGWRYLTTLEKHHPDPVWGTVSPTFL